jgi:hypothetical protein
MAMEAMREVRRLGDRLHHARDGGDDGAFFADYPA